LLSLDSLANSNATSHLFPHQDHPINNSFRV
jgi:hypothetical protein